MLLTRLFGVVGPVWLIIAQPDSAIGSIRLEDDRGKVLEWFHPPQRIVSLAPSHTELLFALGVGDRLVGVSEACDYPEESRRIQPVAGYNSVNLEKIIAVRPDAVIAIRGNDLEGIKGLEKFGIKVFSLDIQSVEQMLLAVMRLGLLTGRVQEAEDLCADLRRRVVSVRSRVSGVDGFPKVMWGGWSETVYTAGRGTIIDDVFRLAGGENVGRRAPGAWPQVSLESLIAWQPEVIITTTLPVSAAGETGTTMALEINRLQVTDGWRALPAVKHRRIYHIDADWLLRPGPRLVLALEQIAAVLHPSVHGQP